MKTPVTPFRSSSSVQILFFLLLLFAMPGVVIAQTAFIVASDGAEYKISFGTNTNFRPSNFSIYDRKGKAINASGDIAAELYGAAEVLVALQSTSSESISGQKINIYETYALDAKQQEDKAAVMGTIGGLVASLGASIKTKAVEKGVEKGSEKLITRMIEWAANSAKVGGQTGVDIAGTALESTGKDALQAQTFAAAHFFQKSAEEQSIIANAERSDVLYAIAQGKSLNINKIKDAWNARMKVNVLDDTAIQIGKLGDRAKRSKGDNFRTYASNVIPFGSTISFMLFGSKDVKKQLNAVNALIEDAFVNTSIKSMSRTDELFGKDGKAQTLAYLHREGFFDNQQSLVDQQAAEEAKIAAEKLAELEKKARQEKAEAQRTARSKATEQGVNEGRAKLASIMQEKLNGVPKEDPGKSDRKNASAVRSYWKNQIKNLENDKKIWKLAKSSAFKKWAKAEKSRNEFDRNSKWWDYFDKEANKHRKTYYYYYGLLGSTTKDAIDKVIAWAEAQYDVADQLYDIAKHNERTRKESIAKKKELEKALEEAQKAIREAEKFQQKEGYAYNDFPIPEFPIEPPSTETPNDPIVGCMAFGCPQPGMDPAEKERRQNKQIGSGSSGSGGGQNLYSVPLFMNQFRQLPLYTNSERVDPDALIAAILGGDYTIADWNDVKVAYNSNPAEFTRQYTTGAGTEKVVDPPYDPEVSGNTHTRGGPNVTWNGSYSAGRINYSGTYFDRQYSIDYHDGQTPGSYLVHDQVGGNEYVIGSWVSNKAYLAKKTGSDADYAFDKSAGPASQETWSGHSVTWDGATITQDTFEVEINPIAKRIESVKNNGVTKTIYRQGSWATDEHASYYYGKNYMGVAWGDVSNYSDPNEEFGWAVTTPSDDLGNYDYTSWGKWQENTAYNPTTGVLTNTKTGAHWIAGKLTPGNEIPTSATATYNGRIVGMVEDSSGTKDIRGAAALQANFGTRTLTGQFKDMTANGVAWKTLNVNASWNAGVNSISGTLSGGGATGTVNGNFFGPQGAEMGGTWQTTAGAEKAAGIYRAKKQ